jgi:hypothetical protein
VTVTASDADSDGSVLTAAASGLPAGMVLTLASTSDADARPGTRTWTVTGATVAAPGDYPVVVTVTDDAGIARTTSFTIRVSKEDAEATYTGDGLAFKPASGPATVHLRATVRSLDGTPGDLANATVTFAEGAATLCTAPVALLGSDPTTGSASCSAALGLGSHAVTVQVGNYYTGSASAVVKVANPDTGLLTGAGFLISTSSAGIYAATPGSKVDFAILATQGRNSSAGVVAANFTSGGRNYLVVSTAIQSLGVSGAKADLRATAKLVDVTDLAHPSIVGTGLTLQMSATDRSLLGSRDSLAITLWSGNTLLFSSDWSGARTQELTLGGGNLITHQ